MVTRRVADPGNPVEIERVSKTSGLTESEPPAGRLTKVLREAETRWPAKRTRTPNWVRKVGRKVGQPDPSHPQVRSIFLFCPGTHAVRLRLRHLATRSRNRTRRRETCARLFARVQQAIPRAEPSNSQHSVRNWRNFWGDRLIQSALSPSLGRKSAWDGSGCPSVPLSKGELTGDL
jgi:hypothetical protein